MTGMAEDPAPHEDLPSDIVFKLWLSTLDAATVLRDLEAATWQERRYVAFVVDERDHPVR